MKQMNDLNLLHQKHTEYLYIDTNKESWKQWYSDYGLLKTIHLFCDTIAKDLQFIWFYPSCTFAHIVLDDYNLSDKDIQWCLNKADEYFLDRLKDLNPEHANALSNNSWENYQYWMLVEGCLITIEFLEWLLTIPEKIRNE